MRRRGIENERQAPLPDGGRTARWVLGGACFCVVIVPTDSSGLRLKVCVGCAPFRRIFVRFRLLRLPSSEVPIYTPAILIHSDILLAFRNVVKCWHRGSFVSAQLSRVLRQKDTELLYCGWWVLYQLVGLRMGNRRLGSLTRRHVPIRCLLDIHLSV